MPVQYAQPGEVESRSWLRSKAVRRRDRHSLLLGKAKEIVPAEKS